MYNRRIMFTFLFIMTLLSVLGLLLVAAMQPTMVSLSAFELERRASSGDGKAKDHLRRAALLGDVMSAIRIKIALLLVLSVLLLVVTFGWLIGTIAALILALEYGAIARLKPIRFVSDKAYAYVEPFWLKIADRHPAYFTFIRSVSPAATATTLGSRHELQHLVETSEGVLTADERKLIVNGLSFSDQLVSSVMTPKAVISTIKHSEFLGPLMLDELHKVGHSRLPVIKEDIDHVIGILHLQSLLALDIKRSVTAEKAMEPRVFYIREDQTLHHALAAFLRTHHHLFIVVNEYRETVGLLTLEDVIEALLGRKIIDEFDGHEDLRSVALRNSVKNNSPAGREDV